jgi:uncharacterized protein (DUF1499 family)
MLVSVERNSNTLFYISISSRFNYIYFLNFYFYFYQILTAFNKLKIMSEVVLLLPNTDSLQQVEDYVRGCTWRFNKVKRNSNTLFYISISSRFNYIYFLNFYFYFYQILTAFNKLKIMSEVVLLLPNTDSLQQVEDYVRGCTWRFNKVKRNTHTLFYISHLVSIVYILNFTFTSTAFHKLRNKSEVGHENLKRLKLFRGFLN